MRGDRSEHLFPSDPQTLGLDHEFFNLVTKQLGAPFFCWTQEERRPPCNRGLSDGAATPARIAAITALPAFERFVFVISVLERYSDQDCSLLLGSTRAEVIAARISGAQHIAESVELQRQLGIASDERARQGSRRSEIQYKPVLQLAASV